MAKDSSSTKPAKPGKDGAADTEQPATTRQLKEASLLLKGVAKFMRYNDDLIPETKKAVIAECESDFRKAMEAPGARVGELESLAGRLTETCQKSVPGYKPSAMRENIEVIFVAVVIAMGIRAYFAQPFKIPTGSMQPTLNGVIGHPDKSMSPMHPYATDRERPGLLRRVAEKIWYGRSWVDIVAEEDDKVLLREDQGFQERTRFKFFTRTHIPLQSGTEYKIPGTKAKVRDLIKGGLFHNGEVKKGDVIARGFVDTGDQVLVDKFSYHWIRPKRGEVFVFTTNDIPYIQEGLLREEQARGISSPYATEPRVGSQHYIKRLGGKPGDHLQVNDGKLYIDGEVAKEFGFQRVMNDYEGYSSGAGAVHLDVKLKSDEYFALGDNSYHSSDGRMWGTVPARNLVGRALFVYLPFGHHWGRIR